MDPDSSLALAGRLGVACLVGLAVGVEREFAASTRRMRHRFAGVRTFPLLGLVAGAAAAVATTSAPVAAALIAVAGALVVVAYACAARRGDLDATTEVAALVVLAAGFLAGLGRMEIAGAMGAVTVLALAEKSRIHGFVGKIAPETLVAGARFAVLALVVLPFLPEGPFGPEPGFRPRELWAYVLVVSGVGFIAHVAQQAAGREHGFEWAGLLGGLVSSTGVTLTFARESREKRDASGAACAVAALVACVVVPLRMFALALAMRPRAALAAAPWLVAPFVASAAAAFVARRHVPKTGDAAASGNPLRLLPALQMAVAFQLVLYAVDWASRRHGSGGVLVTAGLAGLTDVDALAFSLSKSGIDPDDAATYGRALAIGLAANTLFRLVIAVVVGRGTFRARVAAGLAVIAAASAASAAFLRGSP